MAPVDNVLLVILAVAFAAAGGMKLLGAGPTKANFERWTQPVERWVKPTPARLGVGLLEIAIFALAVAGLAGSASGTQLAGLLALWTMIGAILTHGLAGDPRQDVIPPFVLLAVAVWLLVITT